MGFGSVSRGTSKLIMLRFLAFAIFVGVISAQKHKDLYPDTASWGGECATGMMQAPKRISHQQRNLCCMECQSQQSLSSPWRKYVEIQKSFHSPRTIRRKYPFPCLLSLED